MEDDGIQLYQTFLQTTNKHIPVSLFVALYNYVDSHTFYNDDVCYLHPLPIIPQHSPYHQLERTYNLNTIAMTSFECISSGSEIMDCYHENSSANQIIHFLSLYTQSLPLDYFSAKIFISNEMNEHLYEELSKRCHILNEIFLTHNQINCDALKRMVEVRSYSVNKVKTLLQKNTSEYNIQGSIEKTQEYLENEIEILEESKTLLQTKEVEIIQRNEINRMIQIKMLLIHIDSQLKILKNALNHLK
ncbi:hypothetical protein QTN25_009822 [Entamoeba marina]